MIPDWVATWTKDRDFLQLHCSKLSFVLHNGSKWLKRDHRCYEIIGITTFLRWTSLPQQSSPGITHCDCPRPQISHIHSRRRMAFDLKINASISRASTKWQNRQK